MTAFTRPEHTAFLKTAWPPAAGMKHANDGEDEHCHGEGRGREPHSWLLKLPRRLVCTIYFRPERVRSRL